MVGLSERGSISIDRTALSDRVLSFVARSAASERKASGPFHCSPALVAPESPVSPAISESWRIKVWLQVSTD